MSTDASLILDLLDRPIAFHRVFVDITGSVPAALFLSQAFYWQRRCPDGRQGWWWKTAAQWEEETRLTRREQDAARKILRDKNLLDEERKGVPCRLWFRLDLQKLEQAIQFAVSRQTGFDEGSVCRSAAGKFTKRRKTELPSGGKHSEISSETPPEISSENNPAEGGLRDKCKAQSGGLRLDLTIGLKWDPAWSRYLDESRVCRILFGEGVREPEHARRILGEWVSIGQRGFRRGADNALIFLCRQENPIHSSNGDANLPEFA